MLYKAFLIFEHLTAIRCNAFKQELWSKCYWLVKLLPSSIRTVSLIQLQQNKNQLWNVIDLPDFRIQISPSFHEHLHHGRLCIPIQAQEIFLICVGRLKYQSLTIQFNQFFFFNSAFSLFIFSFLYHYLRIFTL